MSCQIWFIIETFITIFTYHVLLYTETTSYTNEKYGKQDLLNHKVYHKGELNIGDFITLYNSALNTITKIEYTKNNIISQIYFRPIYPDPRLLNYKLVFLF